MSADRSDRGERIAFIALSAAVFAYIAARAVLVPVIHDEAMTFFVYVETGRFLPFRAVVDAGNHLLCTAMAWAGWSVFGMHPWALRLPSVLAFVLYALYAWKWGRQLDNRLVRWCFLAAMLLMPFLLDFFSLFRGYGLAMAFWSMALYELTALLHRPSTKSFVLALLAMACAVFSSLNLLALWAALLAVTALFIPLRNGRWRLQPARALAWLACGAAPFLFAAVYALWLAKYGALYYGNTLGLLHGSVASLMPLLFGLRSFALVVAIAALVLACAALAATALRQGNKDFRTQAAALSAAFLLADCMGRVVLFHGQGTLFPEDRTVLHWVPLFTLLIAFTADRLAASARQWQWAALVLLAFPARTLATANLRTTVYWPEQAIPETIFRAVQQAQHASPRLLTIGAYHQMPACWGFGLRERGLALNAMDVSEFPNGGEDLLLINPSRDTVPGGYREMMTAASGHVALYAREHPQPAILLLDSTITPESSDAEYRELWHPAVEAVRGRSYLVELELDLRLLPGQEPMTGGVNVAVDAPGPGQHNDNVMVQFLRSPARSDSIHTLRHLSSIPGDATRIVVFLWNPAQLAYTSSGRMRIYLVDEKKHDAHP